MSTASVTGAMAVFPHEGGGKGPGKPSQDPSRDPRVIKAKELAGELNRLEQDLLRATEEGAGARIRELGSSIKMKIKEIDDVFK